MNLQESIEQAKQTIINDGFEPIQNKFYSERIHAMEGNQCAYIINAITSETTENKNFASVMPYLLSHYDMNTEVYGHWAGETK